MAQNRERLVFECPGRLKKAIRMRAALDGLKPSGVILAALQRYLQEEMVFVDQRTGSSSERVKAKGRDKSE